jgi:hypothetical protein
MIFLIWQVAANIAAEPSCVQVPSQDTIFHQIFPCDRQKSFQNWLVFYFHRHSNENRTMRTVKEIRSDLNWSTNLVNIVMCTCSLIKSVSVIWFISILPDCFISAFATFQKNKKKKPKETTNNIIFDMTSVIIHFSDLTLLFEQWIIFRNLQFILLFLNIWTLTFYCFRLKNVINIFQDFRVSNHCWAFWLSKRPSNHLATLTTLLYAIIRIYDSW